jgi:hypothetical protein
MGNNQSPGLGLTERIEGLQSANAASLVAKGILVQAFLVEAIHRELGRQRAMAYDMKEGIPMARKKRGELESVG